MDRPDATDPVAGFVRLADEAIAEARALEARHAEAGDHGAAEQAALAVQILEAERHAALDGRLPRRSEGFGFGPTRFIGEYEWGAEGKRLVDAVYAMQRHWEKRM